MRFDEDFYRQNQDGSTVLDGKDAYRLTKGLGPMARMGSTILRFQPQQPTLIFGGAGSGKFATIGFYQLVDKANRSILVNDRTGQYMSTTWHANIFLGRKARSFNPQNVGSYPDIHHPVDLFGILRPDDLHLFDNARFISGLSLKEDCHGDNAWVYSGARRIIVIALMAVTLLEGRVTPKRFWQWFNQIDSDDEYFKAFGRATEHLPFEIYPAMVEFHRKKQTSEKEWGALSSKIKDDLFWLSSPPLADAISGDENYLADLGDPKEHTAIYFVTRGGASKDTQSLSRMFNGIAQLHCIRSEKGARPLIWNDESASFGKADFVTESFSENRKFYDYVGIYQSRGQLENLFGKAGAQEIFDSAGLQLYLGGGIRDIHSAKDLADTVGRSTIDVDMPMEQADRAFNAEASMFDLLGGGLDMFDALRTYDHETAQSYRGRKAGRYAIDPAELMRLKDKILILAPGSGLQPILADKLLPYWENPALAGLFGPDPLFPPTDRVTIRRRFWGKTTRRFIREPVPGHLAHWPNHSNGEIAYVEGYRPW